MGRPPCCDKANVKRGPWTPEEDAKILAYVASHGIGNWTLVPQKAGRHISSIPLFFLHPFPLTTITLFFFLFFMLRVSLGLNRCGKSCRLRWTNYLRPDLKHDSFTPEEEACILEMHKTIGSRWSLIARRLPGRTDNDVKNYWNTKLKKKLTKMGIDPITHKPFSQLLSEYGRISGSSLPFLHIQENAPESIHVFDEENVQPQYLFSEASSSSSETLFSSNLTHFACGAEASLAQTGSGSPFSCNEYMVECKNVENLGLSKQESGKNCGENNSSSSSAAAADKFVEEILARDMEIRLSFPEICDENYDF